MYGTVYNETNEGFQVQHREDKTGRDRQAERIDRERPTGRDKTRVKMCRGYSRAEEAGGPGGTTGILVWFFEGSVAN